jgi:muconate cycloisomerase
MRKFEHAAATRELAESVVIRLTLDDGTAGWGETLPREYVTGETMESVIAEITRTWESGSFDFSDDKPSPDTAAPAPAARCAMTLAWDDAQARSSGVALCGAIPAGVRVTGVLGSSDPARTAKRLRLMRLYGLRDFKLKLGFGPDIDAENLPRASAACAWTSMAGGRRTKRLGVWPNCGNTASAPSSSRCSAVRPNWPTSPAAANCPSSPTRA